MGKSKDKVFLDAVQKEAQRLADTPEYSKLAFFIEREDRGRFPTLVVRVRKGVVVEEEKFRVFKVVNGAKVK